MNALKGIHPNPKEIVGTQKAILEEIRYQLS
jgi:hypothetical protein